MAYEKLNLQDGQVLDAAALAHMEDGIENAVPPSTVIVGQRAASANQQLVTDANGTATWVDSLAFESTQNVVIQEDDVGDGPVTGAMPDYSDDGVLAATAIVVGETYIVTYDGVNYTGVAQLAENGAGSNYPGVRLFGSYGDFSYAPLRLYAYGPGIYVDYENDGTHSLKIIHVATTVSTIDPKFLPDIRGTAFYVNVTQTDTDTYTADKTYAEISNAIANGRIPYCVYGDYLLPMVLSTSGMLSGIAPALEVADSHNFFAVVPNIDNENQFYFISVVINKFNQVFAISKEFFFTS